jgi:hypothetical protein
MSATLPAVLSAAGSALGAVTAVVAGIYQMRLRSREKAASVKVIRGLVGSAPLVRDVSDPIDLGVHPAALAPRDASEGTTRLPPYVRRDIDTELRRTVTEPGFVLVVGDTTAGKTRSAFEAMHAILPDHVLIAPGQREGIATAVEAAVATRQSVLWLDDLERFLGPGGLSLDPPPNSTDQC